ncbi:MAG: hypothetical protein R3202_09535 [Candidatus Competibacterales bacterium]|nr:hypothetical protein [Candidatus Competibacterales bacterium]
MSQQHLSLQAPSSARFESFWPGPNAAALQAVQDFALNDEDGQYLLLGPHSSGKSHLAQACCRARWEAGRQATYFDLADAPLRPEALDGFSPGGLLVIDGLQAMRPEDEMTVLRLIDRSRAAAGKLLLCASDWPDQLAIETPDLRSRLQWGAMLELRLMDEQDLAAMLQHRAKLLGARLEPRVAEFLLRRLPRRPGALIDALEQGFQRAVDTGRQLTVPLLREILEQAAQAP